MPLTTYFRSRYGYGEGDFPVTDEVFARSLTLPLHERISTEEQEKVVDLLLNQSKVRLTSVNVDFSGEEGEKVF